MSNICVSIEGRCFAFKRFFKKFTQTCEPELHLRYGGFFGIKPQFQVSIMDLIMRDRKLKLHSAVLHKFHFDNQLVEKREE